ncbi:MULTISPECIES: hypothetical protein [Chryseobacterium]|uniref:Lipoprotein n=1 Tax=Candidatus Chryseobacterium massiliense TaxID=204089 RepID=A0A3D9B2J9_9FLAO|nr:MULTISPECIES: hypothetical protein [Chryseobacterium]REC47870.1 hypothetical protein DRF68_12575 [Candidatus Chryseobacterium massiliae]
MKTFIIFTFFILGCFAFTGCKSKVIPGETKEKIIIQKEIVKDTVLTIEKDSSFYSAYIDCVNGKPVLKENLKTTGNVFKNKAGRVLAVPNVSLQNGILTVNCQKEAERKFFTWREKFLQEWNTDIKQVPVPIPLTKFQKLKMAIGSAVFWLVTVGGCLVGIAYLIRFIIRKKLLK